MHTRSPIFIRDQADMRALFTERDHEITHAPVDPLAASLIARQERRHAQMNRILDRIDLGPSRPLFGRERYLADASALSRVVGKDKLTDEARSKISAAHAQVDEVLDDQRSYCSETDDETEGERDSDGENGGYSHTPDHALHAGDHGGGVFGRDLFLQRNAEVSRAVGALDGAPVEEQSPAGMGRNGWLQRSSGGGR